MFHAPVFSHEIFMKLSNYDDTAIFEELAYEGETERNDNFLEAIHKLFVMLKCQNGR